MGLGAQDAAHHTFLAPGAHQLRQIRQKRFTFHRIESAESDGGKPNARKSGRVVHRLLHALCTRTPCKADEHTVAARDVAYGLLAAASPESSEPSGEDS